MHTVGVDQPTNGVGAAREGSGGPSSLVVAPSAHFGAQSVVGAGCPASHVIFNLTSIACWSHSPRLFASAAAGAIGLVGVGLLSLYHSPPWGGSGRPVDGKIIEFMCLCFTVHALSWRQRSVRGAGGALRRSSQCNIQSIFPSRRIMRNSVLVVHLKLARGGVHGARIAPWASLRRQKAVDV